MLGQQLRWHTVGIVFYNMKKQVSRIGRRPVFYLKTTSCGSHGQMLHMKLDEVRSGKEGLILLALPSSKVFSLWLIGLSAYRFMTPMRRLRRSDLLIEILLESPPLGPFYV
jgi:hypothetical protein